MFDDKYMFGDGRFYPKHDSLPGWVLVHPRQLNHVLSYRRFVSRPWDAECPTILDISKGISNGH
jgi:hypothetical protein